MTKELRPTWITKTADGTLLRLLIQPKASRSEIVGIHGDRLKVRIAAPPIEGAANEALLGFLKKALGVSSGQIYLVRGATSRAKDVRVQGLSVEDIFLKLKK